MPVYSVQQARDHQARDIVRVWASQDPEPSQILAALTAYANNRDGLHMAAHLVTAVRRARLVPGV